MNSSKPTPREFRRPLFLPIVTNPPLLQSWSENVSRTGVGLVGRLPPDADLPRGRMEVTLELPDLTTLKAAGTIVWSRRTSADGVALGLALTELSPAVAQRLARFVAEFRVRVAVVGATRAERVRIDDAAGDLVLVEYFDDEAHVPRYDVGAVVLCGRLPEGGPEQGLLDVAPRVIALTDAEPLDLVRAFQQGRLAAALPYAASNDAIRAALFDACRDWSVRSELRATTLRLAREMQARRLGKPAAADLGVIAGSPAMRRLFQQVDVVAPRKIVVLLEGETGTGKGVLAKAVHARSDRAHRPLVVQDCGTLTDTLLDSELFGHVRGAFTGANTDHPGLFVVADGGTVFLDEIENTTPALQAKLLRVIETGEIRAVGGTRTRIVDVRVIAATNTDLQEAVAAGRFRADLYYRLSVFPLSIPPLRDRGADVVTLAQSHLENAARLHGLAVPQLSPEALRAIERYRWPGNVRQLKNAMERAVLLTDDGTVRVEHLPSEVAAVAPGRAKSKSSLEDRVDDFERDAIEAALHKAGGVVTRAARALGKDRVTLSRRMRALGIVAPPRA